MAKTIFDLIKEIVRLRWREKSQKKIILDFNNDNGSFILALVFHLRKNISKFKTEYEKLQVN